MSKHVNKIAFGFAAVSPAVLPDEAGNSGWIKIMPAGPFKGRDGRGPFNAGDLTAMQAIVDRTLAWLGGTELMIDYDHQSFFAVQPGVGGNAPAAGWVKEFQVRDDGIYARPEWTAAAAAKIAAKEYRYISPLFTSDKAGRVDRIDNAALINQPALDLSAVAAAASRFLPGKEEELTLLERLAAALGLEASTSEETLVTAVTAFAAERDKIVVAAGLKKGATTDEVVTAMSTRRAASDPDPKEFVPMSMFTGLRDELNAFKDQGIADKATEAVDQAVKDGKIPPANRTWAMGLAKRDLTEFNAFVANQPVLTGRQLQTETLKAGDPELSETDLVAMKALGLSKEAFVAARKMEAQ